MVRRIIGWLASAGLIALILFPSGPVLAFSQHPVAHGSVVARYIGAIQRRDFRTVIDLTYSYQQKVNAIKAQNPKVLWPKLIGEYYQARINTLSQNPGYWVNYAETLLGWGGDPTQAIRKLFGLLPASCKWTISETRVQRGGSIVYVTVNYPEIRDAPVAGPQILKQAILQFAVGAPAKLVVGVEKVPQGDTYWTGGPGIRTAMASRFLAVGSWNPAIAQLEPLQSANRLPAAARGVLASAYFQRVTHQCFATWVNSGAKRFVTFKDEKQCMTDLRQVLTLGPNLRGPFVNLLLSDVGVARRAGEPDAASSLVKMASRFAVSDPGLESRAMKLRQVVGNDYLAMADHHFKGWGFDEAEPDLKNAIELLPAEGTRRALDMAKEAIRERRPGGNQVSIFGVLDLMKKLGLRIPAGEVPQFLQLAQGNLPTGFGFQNMNVQAEWEKRVRELAAPAGGPHTPSPPQPVPASSANVPPGVLSRNTLLSHGFSFIEQGRPMCTIKGPDGPCDVQEFVWPTSASAGRVFSCTNLDRATYKGHCAGGKLQGVSVVIADGSTKVGKEAYVSFFSKGQMAYPALRVPLGPNGIFVIQEKSGLAYGCVNPGVWDHSRTQGSCPKFLSIFGSNIFSNSNLQALKAGSFNLGDYTSRFLAYLQGR